MFDLQKSYCKFSFVDLQRDLWGSRYREISISVYNEFR